MKKLFTLMALAVAVLFVGCEGDDYQRGQTSGDDTEQTNDLLPAKDGRVAIAYVTYYGKAIPDPMLMTHINYAFAELYVKGNLCRLGWANRSYCVFP